MMSIPFIKFKIAAALVLSVGCNRGPITIAGFIVTMSKPFSFTNFQAASSANVFERTYHNWKKNNKKKYRHKKLCLVWILNYTKSHVNYLDCLANSYLIICLYQFRRCHEQIVFKSHENFNLGFSDEFVQHRELVL